MIQIAATLADTAWFFLFVFFCWDFYACAHIVSHLDCLQPCVLYTCLVVCNAIQGRLHTESWISLHFLFLFWFGCALLHSTAQHHGPSKWLHSSESVKGREMVSNGSFSGASRGILLHIEFQLSCKTLFRTCAHYLELLFWPPCCRGMNRAGFGGFCVVFILLTIHLFSVFVLLSISLWIKEL